MGLLSNIFQSPVPSASATSDLQNPALWLQNALSGGSTVSGESVSTTSAMSLSAYYACLRVISEDIAKLPLNLFRRLDPTGKELAKDHPLFRILRSEPNSEMSSFSWRETMQSWASGWGNGVSEIERDNTGRPVALWPINPSRVEIKRDKNRKVVYDVHSGDISGDLGAGNGSIDIVRFQADDIFHLHGLGGNGISGFSVLGIMAESLGVSIAAQNYSAAFYKNDATPSVVLVHPETLDEPSRETLRKSWDRVHSGAGQAHKTAVLEEGIKIERLSIPPGEAQLLETKSWQVEEIARWFRVPPHKIQHLANANFSNIESENRNYVDDTLLAPMVRWESEISRKLLFEDEKEEYFVEHNVDSLLRGDSAARANLYRTLLNLGALSPNEIRDKENMNPIPDGGEYFIQQNMTTLSALVANPPVPGQTSAPEEEDDDEDEEDEDEEDDNTDDSDQSDNDDSSDDSDKRDDVDNQAPVIMDASARVIKKESKALDRALKKYGEDKAKFSVWASKFHQEQADYILNSFEPIVKVLLPAYAIANMTDFSLDFFAEIELDIRSMFGKKNDFAGFEAKWTEILFQNVSGFLRNEQCLNQN